MDSPETSIFMHESAGKANLIPDLLWARLALGVEDGGMSKRRTVGPGNPTYRHYR